MCLGQWNAMIFLDGVGFSLVKLDVCDALRHIWHIKPIFTATIMTITNFHCTLSVFCISIDQQDKLQCISQRRLKLHLTAAKGVHHHVPLLFDYFHLSAMCMTVHAVVLAIQPNNGFVTSLPSVFKIYSCFCLPDVSIQNFELLIKISLWADHSVAYVIWYH